MYLTEHKSTSKGQVTIPQAIRERLGLLPYSEVEFELDGDTVRLRKARRSAARGAAEWGDWSSAMLAKAAERGLPDFYIGAHAAIAGHTLLTRGPRRYRTYWR